MNHSIKFLLQLEPELLKEGSGFRYQLFLKNQSHLEINLFDFTVHDIEIQDITFQETLSPEWILPDFYPLFPQKLSPQETFQMEGELLTYFPLRSKHDYEVKIQIKYYFALTELQEETGILVENPLQTLSSNVCSFHIPTLPPMWHKDLERQALMLIGEQTGYFLKEILVLPLDVSSAYTFNILPVLLPDEALLVLRAENLPLWKEELIQIWVETVSPYRSWFKSFRYLDLSEKLLYRMIFSFYAAHEVSPSSNDDHFYFPENWS
ncbi:MAG: hypothetical protein AABZ60_25160 [Planctomycetota bacterium]